MEYEFFDILVKKLSFLFGISKYVFQFNQSQLNRNPFATKFQIKSRITLPISKPRDVAASSKATQIISKLLSKTLYCKNDDVTKFCANFIAANNYLKYIIACNKMLDFIVNLQICYKYVKIYRSTGLISR